MASCSLLCGDFNCPVSLPATLFAPKAQKKGPSRIISPVIAALTNMSNPLLFLVSGHLSAQSFELVS